MDEVLEHQTIEMSVDVRPSTEIVADDLDDFGGPHEEIKPYTFMPRWIRKDKVQKIKDLELFPQIHDKVLNGEPDAEIARFIQSHGFYLDDEMSTIISWIAHYRATVPKGMILVRTLPRAAVNARIAVNKSLDIIAEMDRVYLNQKIRVERSLVKEAKHFDSLLYESLGREMTRQVEMLQVCVKLRKEIGLTENQFEEARRGSNQLENFSLNKAYGRLGIDETLRDPASRTRVLTALESMLQLTIRRTNESDQPIKFDAKHQVIDIDRVKQTESIVKKDSDELVILGEIDLKSIEQLRDEAEGGDDTEDMGDGLE